MVLYFSGTGNSTFVAITLANFLGLKSFFIPEVDPHGLETPDKRLLLVCPVYSWGVPPLISKFLLSLPEEFW